MINKIYKQLLRDYAHVGSWWPGDRFEICVGAVLTQNTNWNNVEKALDNLRTAGVNNFEIIDKMNIRELQPLVKPAGFYKQKSRYLKNLAQLVLSFDSFDDFLKDVTREQLLSVRGIGKETADSILLYACDKLHFVVDVYTRRMLAKEAGFTGKEPYDDIKSMFEKSLKKDVLTYKRMHGMIVEHGKNKFKSTDKKR